MVCRVDIDFARCDYQWVERPLQQLAPLTGLRGIAAYSVLLAHVLSISFNNSQLGIHTIGLAYFGMSLFFVLSGFVIHYNYASLFRHRGFAAASKRFFIARFARLYPLYFVVLLMSVFWASGSPALTDAWMAFVSLTLTQTWLDTVSAVGGIAGVSWSISTEFMLYLFFIALVLPIERIKRPAAAMIVLSISGTAGLLLLFFNHAAVLETIVPVVYFNPKVSDNPWRWLTYYSPYVRCLDFFLGVLASKTFLSRQERPLGDSRVAFLTITAAIVWCAIGAAFAPPSEVALLAFFATNFMFAPAIATALILLCRYRTVWSVLLSAPILLAAGEISYSVYLLQELVFQVSRHTFTVGPQDMSSIGILSGSMRVLYTIGITTALAYGTYWLIEHPARAAIRRFGSQRGRAVGPVSNNLLSYTALSICRSASEYRHESRLKTMSKLPPRFWRPG